MPLPRWPPRSGWIVESNEYVAARHVLLDLRAGRTGPAAREASGILFVFVGTLSGRAFGKFSYSAELSRCSEAFDANAPADHKVDPVGGR